MNKNIFFKNEGPYLINDLFKFIKLKKKIKIYDIKSLSEASDKDLSFYDSINYKDLANKTLAVACITTEKLKMDLPKNCIVIVVKNVLFELCTVLKKFYPLADVDMPDASLKLSKESKFKKVKLGHNVLIGKNCKIGKGTIIGSNTIIEHDVVIGKNCVIGSNITLKNSLIGDGVVIQDGCKIGLKGFGFIPLKDKNLKFPHKGKVLIKDDVEIAANCTIDRGSIGDTVIEKNTYLDNQIHIAHNVRIGENSIIAGQVGIAGSSIIGNNVKIGGQAGISGHLKIGNNVEIAGGSGVIKDIPDDSKVMGYPAKNIREFLKENR